MLPFNENDQRGPNQLQIFIIEQTPAGNVSHKLHYYLTKFRFDTTCDSKEEIESVTSKLH